MGRVKIPYYVVKRNGRGFWQPTPEMRARGARPMPCGPDGPEAWRVARDAYDAWRACQKPPEITSRPAHGTLAAAFAEYRTTPEWAAKATRTREEWERCWALIGPTFGPCRPSTVTLAQISGFRQLIEQRVSLREAHRCIKVWRALWRVAAALRYCARDSDPSLGVRNIEPKTRTAVWSHAEALKLAKTAWRHGYFGLCAVIAVAWDTSLSPIDVRGLSLSQRQGDVFHLERAKEQAARRSGRSAGALCALWTPISRASESSSPLPRRSSAIALARPTRRTPWATISATCARWPSARMNAAPSPTSAGRERSKRSAAAPHRRR